MTEGMQFQELNARSQICKVIYLFFVMNLLNLFIYKVLKF